jgi:5-methylcytosine-specific restriction protein A
MGRLSNIRPRISAAKPRLKPMPKRADQFYLSIPWRSLVSEIKQERGNYCETCGTGGKGARIIGDHIKELKDGGAPLDPKNIKLLCAKHHGIKTAQARARRARGETLRDERQQISGAPDK